MEGSGHKILRLGVMGAAQWPLPPPAVHRPSLQACRQLLNPSSKHASYWINVGQGLS